MPHMHTLTDNLLAKSGFSVAITAATTNGTSVDTQDFRRAMAIFYAAPTGAGTTMDCKLQESADNAAWSDVNLWTGVNDTAYANNPGGTTVAAFAQATTAGGAEIQVMSINVQHTKRYLRLVGTGAGGSAAGQAYGLIILGEPNIGAVIQDHTPVLMV